MTESTTSHSRRGRRSTRISQQLERARQRNADQLAEQRAREQRVEGALAAFVEAGDAIAIEEASCEDKVAAYQRKIDELRAETQTKITDKHTRQALAALAIHEAGRTVDQVADLLELRSEKEARRLIAAGRAAPEQEASGTRSDEESNTESGATDDEATEQVPPMGGDPVPTGLGKQNQWGRVDAQQHGSSTGFVPSVLADGGGQSA